MSTALVVAGIVLSLAGFIALESWGRKKKIAAAFAGRASLQPEQFYETYFKGKGIPYDIVSGVRAILEEQLNADLSRLADTDDFSKNLRFFWSYDSMADVEVVCALEERFGIDISDAEAEQAKTVADIVNLVHAKTRPSTRL